jgi:hypothetical protein
MEVGYCKQLWLQCSQRGSQNCMPQQKRRLIQKAMSSCCAVTKGGSAVDIQARNSTAEMVGLKVEAELMTSHTDTLSHAVQACVLSHPASKGCRRCILVTHHYKAVAAWTGTNGSNRIGLSSNAYAGYANKTECQHISAAGVYLPTEQIQFMRLEANRKSRWTRRLCRGCTSMMRRT